MKLELAIEAAIRQTLVIENKQSVGLAVERIVNLLNSDKKAQECDATAAPLISELLAQKNPLEDIIECYVPVSVENKPPKDGAYILREENGDLFEAFFKKGKWVLFDGDGETFPVEINGCDWLKKITLPSPAVNDIDIDFAMWITGHDRETCEQLRNNFYHKPNAPSVKDDWKETLLNKFIAVDEIPEPYLEGIKAMLDYIETNLKP